MGLCQGVEFFPRKLRPLRGRGLARRAVLESCATMYTARPVVQRREWKGLCLLKEEPDATEALESSTWERGVFGFWSRRTWTILFVVTGFLEAR